MLKNTVVLTPPEDSGSGSQFSVMKSLLSETILQVKFSSLILGANHGIQIKLDIQYYIWLHGDRIQCPLQARSHKGAFGPAGAQCPCSHSEPLVLGMDPVLRTGITEAPDNWRWCDSHSPQPCQMHPA